MSFSYLVFSSFLVASERMPNSATPSVKVSQGDSETSLLESQL